MNQSHHRGSSAHSSQPLHSLLCATFGLLFLSLTSAGCTQALVDTNSLSEGEFSLMALHKTDNLQAVCSIKVPDPEPSDLAAMAKISADEASDVALSTFTSTVARGVDLDNENGCLVYGINLDNGYDAKIDAGNGVFLYADTGQNGGTNHED